MLALLSLVTCPFIGVFGLVLANKAEGRIRDSNGRLQGIGLVNAARVVSLISITLSAVLLVVLGYLLAESLPAIQMWTTACILENRWSGQLCIP